MASSRRGGLERGVAERALLQCSPLWFCSPQADPAPPLWFFMLFSAPVDLRAKESITRFIQEVLATSGANVVSTTAQFRVLQGKSKYILRLDTFARTSTGEKPDAVITGLPTRGAMLRVLNVDIGAQDSGETGEALAAGDRVAWSREFGLTVALVLPRASPE